MYNFTEDAHPIHIHEVQFQLVDRQPIGGAARPPESSERGFKDTIIAYPGEITESKPCSTLRASTSGTAISSSTRTTK